MKNEVSIKGDFTKKDIWKILMKICSDLMDECEDNEVMRETIRNYFEVFEIEEAWKMNEMEAILKVLNLNTDSIEITKTTRGYTYSVKGYGKDFEVILKRIEGTIRKLEEKYGG